MEFKQEIYSIITTIISVVASGGWFLHYKANKRIKNGEATQSEADGWAKQQEVYQKTIDDLKNTCAFIANDRNLLREENTKLRQENNSLRCRINDLENTIFDLKREVSRLGRRIEAISKESKNK